MDKHRSLTVCPHMDNHNHKRRLLLLLSTGLMDNSDSPSSSLLSLNNHSLHSPSSNTVFNQHKAMQVRCHKHMVDRCHKHMVGK